MFDGCNCSQYLRGFFGSINGSRFTKALRKLVVLGNREPKINFDADDLAYPALDKNDINYHIQGMSFVDWARGPLCCGENAADFSASYQLLDQTVLRLRAEKSSVFSKSLADWTAVGSKEVGGLGIEKAHGSLISKFVGRCEKKRR